MFRRWRDQEEQHDQGTIDEVLEDQDVEKGGDTLEEPDREAYLLEQMPLPGHPEIEKERLASGLRLPRRARVAIRRHTDFCDTCQKKHSCKCHVLLELYRMMSMPRRHFDVRVVRTQGQDIKHTWCHHVQSRSGSRCVRDC